MTLKFHQFYSPKNTRRDTHKTQQPFYQLETAKNYLSQPKILKKNRKAGEKIFEFF